MKINNAKMHLIDLRKWLGLAIPLVGIVTVLVPLKGYTHGRWIIPSHTILSGEKPEYVALDFSISNEMFFADMSYGGISIEDLAAPKLPSANGKTSIAHDGSEKTPESIRKAIMKAQFGSTRVTAIQPDGSVVEAPALVNLVRKSATAMPLHQSGTYRFRVSQRPVHIAFIKTAAGDKKRMFGHPDAVRPLLEQGDVVESVIRVFNNVDTYVTRNELSKKALQPTSEGLEIAAITHPNELFVGEKASFTLMLNGEPVGAGVPVTVVRGGTRYRNDREAKKLITDANGRITYSWPKAGMFFLESEIKLPSTQKTFTTDVYALYLTLEVNP